MRTNVRELIILSNKNILFYFKSFFTLNVLSVPTLDLGRHKKAFIEGRTTADRPGASFTHVGKFLKF